MLRILCKLFLFGLSSYSFFPKCILCLEIPQMNFAVYFSVYHFTSLIIYFCIVRGLEALLCLRVVFGDKIQFWNCCIFYLFLCIFSSNKVEKFSSNNMKLIQSMFCIFISLANSQTYFTKTSLKNHSYIENPDNTGLIVVCGVLTAILCINARYFLEQN